jgi:hypothetical protein
MARTFIRQASQIRKSDNYDDTIAPSLAAYETNAVSIQDDLNSLRSQVQNLLNRNGADFPTGNWYDDVSQPSGFESSSKRGVNTTSQDLHNLERKRVLVTATSLTDITVGAGNNFVILGAGQLPTNTTAAIGAVDTLGTVAAYNSTFGAHSLDEVGGATAISPKNLCVIVDGATREILQSDNRDIYGLFQTESSTDGSTITDTTPDRVQLSFVRINATGDDLEAVPFADIEGKTINYATVTRKALEDLTEQDFLRGAEIDVPSGSTVTRQAAYDNQGATPVAVSNDAFLSLGVGYKWEVQDDTSAALFTVQEDSGVLNSLVSVGSAAAGFVSSAGENQFSNGIKANTSGTQIDVGVNAGVIETSGNNNLTVRSGPTGELLLDDGNRTGSTWAGAGILLTDSTPEWDTFESKFGEVSLLNAISKARRNSKAYANVTTDAAADSNVGGIGGGTNLDAQLPDLSQGNFLVDYDVFLNGSLLRPGADASANNDYYPGTTLSDGQLKFEFDIKSGDVLCVVPYA